MKCINPENHENHICQMKINQLFSEVNKLGHDAVYYCQNCESPSRDSETLCNPKEFKGKVGVLKWK